MEVNMESNRPNIFIRGIDKVIKKDLQKHKDLNARCKQNLDAYRTAVSHQVKKKKHYKSLIGGGKFDDDALRDSMDMISIDIRHHSDKVHQTQEEMKHHTLIIDTLSKQLEEYNSNKQSIDEYSDNAVSH